MNIQEYSLVKDFSYEEYIEYLWGKYGEVEEDYFTPSFVQNKNKRFQKEQVYRHHIKEDIVADLSKLEIAKTNSFEYQKANNLVYCNLLEHIFLHILIGEQNKGLGFGGSQLMIAQANDMFVDGILSPDWLDTLQLLIIRNEQGISVYNTLLEHNATLFNDLDETLSKNDRALVVLGTGLGKTTTALAYLRKYNYKGIVLCPNNTIVNGWSKYPEVLAITYQSFMNSYLTFDYTNFDVLICDEAHHCSALRWGEGVKYVLNQKILKVIGLTATPKENEKNVYNNTVNFFNNLVCKGYTILEGIEQEKIHNFSYIGAIYDKDAFREDLLDSYKELDAELDLAINNTPNMKTILSTHMPTGYRKGIVFCSSIDAIDEAIAIIKNSFPNVICKKFHSNLPKEEIEDTRKWFEFCKEGYIFTVNMITEGAHYPGVNTLIMFRKTHSSLVFNQQLGRIITLTRDKNPNGIVFDFVNNANLIENGTNSFVTSLKEIYKQKKQKNLLKSDCVIVKSYLEEISTVLKRIKEERKLNPILWKEFNVVFPNATQLKKALESIGIYITIEGIRECCNKEKEYYGQHFLYKKRLEIEENKTETELKKIGKQVLCINLDKTYSTLREASLDTGISKERIKKCCEGWLKDANGFCFKYI